jgi:hypothetical protein
VYLCIGKYLPPGGGREYQPMSFRGKISNEEEKKEENVKEKRRKDKK